MKEEAASANIRKCSSLFYSLSCDALGSLKNPFCVYRLKQVIRRVERCNRKYFFLRVDGRQKDHRNVSGTLIRTDLFQRYPAVHNRHIII